MSEAFLTVGKFISPNPTPLFHPPTNVPQTRTQTQPDREQICGILSSSPQTTNTKIFQTRHQAINLNVTHPTFYSKAFIHVLHPQHLQRESPGEINHQGELRKALGNVVRRISVGIRLIELRRDAGVVHGFVIHHTTREREKNIMNKLICCIGQNRRLKWGKKKKTRRTAVVRAEKFRAI